MRVCFYKIRSSHTSGRDILNDYAGNCGYEFVRIGNLLASRLVLLLILCSCRGCRWLVEQPEGSSLPHTKRFQQFIGMCKVSWIYFTFACGCICLIHAAFCTCVTCFYEVFTTSFWMGAFNGKTPKRHRLWSNDWGLLQEIHAIGGHMSRTAMQALPGQSLVKKYHDKHGKLRRVGIPARLKESQYLSCKLITTCSFLIFLVRFVNLAILFQCAPGSGLTQHPLRT